MNPTPDPRAVRELAYRLWEERGRPDESADDIWLEAERRLVHVHGDFTRSETPTINASALARAQSVSAADPDGAPPDAQYSPENPPVNAEFKWAAAELQKSEPAGVAGKRAPAASNQRR